MPSALMTRSMRPLANIEAPTPPVAPVKPPAPLLPHQKMPAFLRSRFFPTLASLNSGTCVVSMALFLAARVEFSPGVPYRQDAAPAITHFLKRAPIDLIAGAILRLLAVGILMDLAAIDGVLGAHDSDGRGADSGCSADIHQHGRVPAHHARSFLTHVD